METDDTAEATPHPYQASQLRHKRIHTLTDFPVVFGL